MILTKITKLQKLILKGKVLDITSKSVYVSLNITPRYIHNQQAQSKYKQSVLYSLKNYIHKLHYIHAHLKIYFWRLLMSLKTKCSLKKLLNLGNKKQNNFKINNAGLKKKNKEKVLEILLFYTCLTKSLVT